MPQHLWEGGATLRICDACRAFQAKVGGEWQPPHNSICPGDDDDDGRRVTRRRPDAPSDAPRGRMLEDA
jgi:hypothetical protein